MISTNQLIILNYKKYIETCKELKKIFVTQFIPDLVNVKLVKSNQGFNIESDDIFKLIDFIDFLEENKLLNYYMTNIFDYLLSSSCYESVEHKEYLFFDRNKLLKFFNLLQECLKRGLEEREDD